MKYVGGTDRMEHVQRHPQTNSVTLCLLGRAFEMSPTEARSLGQCLRIMAGAEECHPNATSGALLDAVEQAIVDLSVHPAGCVEWTWYENLCLEVAERLDNAVSAFKASSAHALAEERGSVVPSDAEIGKAARQFSDDQGTVPTAFAFQAGACWARNATSVQTDVRFCSWTWDTTEQRWLTRCGYGFAPASDRDHTGKVLPFPFCPYCGAQIRKPNAHADLSAASADKVRRVVGNSGGSQHGMF